MSQNNHSEYSRAHLRPETSIVVLLRHFVSVSSKTLLSILIHSIGRPNVVVAFECSFFC